MNQNDDEEESGSLLDPETNNENKKQQQQQQQQQQPPPPPPKRMSKGLSELTRRCFGKPLDKSECLSNWENRPLRRAQLRYAALDAYVLIKIYDYIETKCKEIGVDFNMLISRSRDF